MMSVPPVLSTKEVLLEHLYAVISPLVPGYGDRVVGMLADSTDLQLMAVLGNQQLLRDTVTEALAAIKKSEGCSNPKDQDMELLGNDLFHLVAEVEPALCAQITGMLLELEPRTLQHLLTDDAALSAAITRSKQEYMIQLNQQNELPDLVAEKLYEAVSELYERNTPKITGMLSDLPSDELTRLLQSPSQFKQTVELCRTALEDTHQWLAETAQ